MVNPSLAWTALFAPLASCVIIVLFFLRSKALSSATAILGILTSFFCCVVLFTQLFNGHAPSAVEHSFPWVETATLNIPLGVLIDPLAIMMLLVVTGVGSAIFIYSKGYMADDPSLPRFFAYLSLFAFSMIGIVISNNFIQLFIFWELVGVSSYLLIGFWYQKPSAADAGMKAFIVNRVADFGFLCGIILLWSLSGADGVKTFIFSELASIVGQINPAILTITALLIFCGVLGKSAQVPLHVWLADAMEGPTPVSALIHAATMVAAGIYLLARTFFLFAPLETALTVIAYVGVFTAFMAATLAVAENDIKRILAYSTLSQLGFMVMALGLAGPMQGMFHLTTHAFFKALLFLGAGSVIYGLHHEQNIWKMRGLLKQMPITGFTFLIGTLALCGIFPFSGFWSKDEILALAHEHNTFLYWTATVTSALTAFYMGRLFWIAFWGKPDSHDKHPAHESPLVMTIPLMFLAVLSIIGGFIGIPHFLYPELKHVELNMTVALISSAAAILGLAGSFVIYGKRPAKDPFETQLGGLYTVLKNKYYFDALYSWYVNNVQQTIAKLFDQFEKIILTRVAVHGVTDAAKVSGNALRKLQTGLVQFYGLMFVLGVIVLFVLTLRTL